MHDIEDLGKRPASKAYVRPTNENMIRFVKEFLSILQANQTLTKPYMDKVCQKLQKKLRIHPSKADIRQTVEQEFASTPLPPILHSWLIRKGCRTASGVKVVTIVTSPSRFSCLQDCAMCPQEYDKATGKPTQPRSYISSEPAMMRARETRVSQDTNEFNVIGQFRNRINTYKFNGVIDPTQTGSEKIEVIVSGGTWDFHQPDYRDMFMTEIYWSANTLDNPRPPKSLEEEQLENETAKYRIIGLTIETRPDKITKESILEYLRYGVTRVQIGVQHYDDMVLKKINRKCYLSHTIQAIRLLKQAAFKVVVHLMPDLPGSTPELDLWMFHEAIHNPDLQFDDVKIYPTAVCQSHDPKFVLVSKIADWYKDGSYKPYAEQSLRILIDVILYYKQHLNPWVRIQRLVRDIPEKSITAGYDKVSNLRQEIHTIMDKEDIQCKCIFCMEIGDREFENWIPRLSVRPYRASTGLEYHISIEAHSMTPTQLFLYALFHIYAFVSWLLLDKPKYWYGPKETYKGLFGFLRLRIDPDPGGDFLPQLQGCGLIREVHVYGTSLGTGQSSTGSQHRGFGKQLVRAAEQITRNHGLHKMAVIAGVGTREYYAKKCGYTKGQFYMFKSL